MVKHQSKNWGLRAALFAGIVENGTAITTSCWDA